MNLYKNSHTIVTHEIHTDIYYCFYKYMYYINIKFKNLYIE